MDYKTTQSLLFNIHGNISCSFKNLEIVTSWLCSAHATSKVQVPDPSPLNCRMSKIKPSSITNRDRYKFERPVSRPSAVQRPSSGANRTRWQTELDETPVLIKFDDPAWRYYRTQRILGKSSLAIQVRFEIELDEIYTDRARWHESDLKW